MNKFSIFLILLALSHHAQSSFIKNEDISTVAISTPKSWQVYNTNQLFDGISDRYTATRFAAYQNEGAKLSASNTLSIEIALINAINVSSLSFFNDWRSILGQQVESMTISLFGTDQLLWEKAFTGLKKNTWEQQSLFDFMTPVHNVTGLTFTVTGSQGNHFEIRELMIGYQTPFLLQTSSIATQPVEAYGPNVFLIFLLGVSFIGFQTLYKSRASVNREK